MTARIILRPIPGLQIAQGFFLAAGLLALGYVGFNITERYIYQAYETRAFDSAVAVRRTAPGVPIVPITQSLIGKIEIPRLKIAAIVREGVDDRTLDIAAGHIPQTALPGQEGNAGIAAHRDTLFRNLKDVRREDRIKVTTLQGEYTYRVVSTRIVQPADVSVLDPLPGEKALTLVTCYPFYFVGSAPKRFIVHALLVAD